MAAYQINEGKIIMWQQKDQKQWIQPPVYVEFRYLLFEDMLLS